MGRTARVTREQVLAAARDEFVHRGFEGATLAGIGARLQISPAALLRHAPTKRELFLEVLSDVAAGMRRTVRAATSAADGPRQQVEAGFSAWFLWVDEHRDGFNVLFSGEVRRDPEFAEEAAKAQRQFVDGISDAEYQAYLDDPFEPLLDRSVSGQFPPGSTFKPMMAAAGLHDGARRPDGLRPDTTRIRPRPERRW